MDELLPGVAATSLLVNESRARLPDLSRDRFARDWIPEVLRTAVHELWADYAEAVYPHDDVVVSVRSRSIIELLEAALHAAPDLVLVNVGAGFTSYPWLLPLRRTLELDRPEVVRAKRMRIDELWRSGILPHRDVTLVDVDLLAVGAVERVRTAIEGVTAPGAPLAIVMEGVAFYLDRATVMGLVGLANSLADEVVAAAVSYWPAHAEENPVLRRQAEWFRARGIPADATFLRPGDLTGALGPATRILDPASQQRTAGLEQPLPEVAIVPEHLAVLAP
jgi:O-methyltransferase involved in polyketide biosynthesis